MSIITAQDVYDLLEGFEIDEDVISSQWVLNKCDRIVVPFAERFLGFSLSAETEVTRYVNGSGAQTLIIPDKSAKQLVSLKYINSFPDSPYNSDVTRYQLIPDQGIIKSVVNFAYGEKNIMVTYKIGWNEIPADLKEAVTMLTAIEVLKNLANRTGGGNLSVQDFNRTWGERGKFTYYMQDLNISATTILRNYRSGVI